jgi:hypothetical protein
VKGGGAWVDPKSRALSGTMKDRQLPRQLHLCSPLLCSAAVASRMNSCEPASCEYSGNVEAVPTDERALLELRELLMLVKRRWGRGELGTAHRGRCGCVWP